VFVALVPKQEASRRLGIAVRSLEDPRYRLRIGLPAIHIGRRIGFDEGDIDRLIARGREKLPVKCGTESSASANEADPGGAGKQA
jgi:hypothetical protein